MTHKLWLNGRHTNQISMLWIDLKSNLRIFRHFESTIQSSVCTMIAKWSQNWLNIQQHTNHRLVWLECKSLKLGVCENKQAWYSAIAIWQVYVMKL